MPNTSIGLALPWGGCCVSDYLDQLTLSKLKLIFSELARKFRWNAIRMRRMWKWLYLDPISRLAWSHSAVAMKIMQIAFLRFVSINENGVPMSIDFGIEHLLRCSTSQLLQSLSDACSRPLLQSNLNVVAIAHGHAFYCCWKTKNPFETIQSDAIRLSIGSQSVLHNRSIRIAKCICWSDHVVRLIFSFKICRDVNSQWSSAWVLERFRTFIHPLHKSFGKVNIFMRRNKHSMQYRCLYNGWWRTSEATMLE